MTLKPARRTGRLGHERAEATQDRNFGCEEIDEHC